MDSDFPPKFLASLASFFQNVCNEDLDYKSDVKFSGHLFVTVDSGNTVEFIVDEEIVQSNYEASEPPTTWTTLDNHCSVDIKSGKKKICSDDHSSDVQSSKDECSFVYQEIDDVRNCPDLPIVANDTNIKQELSDELLLDSNIEKTTSKSDIENLEIEDDVEISDEEDQSPSDREQRQQYDCELCPAVFTNHQELKAHQKIHPLECEFCGKEFKAHSSLRNHRRSHTGHKPFHCGKCGNSFRQKTDLRRHPCTDYQNGRFDCDFCDESFTNHLAYIRHQRTHPCKCDFCGKDFDSYGHLKEHRRLTHTQEKRFFCACGSGFAIKRDLKRHETRCSGQPEEYPCELCNEVFTSALDHKRHQKTHPKICDFCGKEFKQYKELRRHRLHHIGEKRFVCEVCGNKYLHEYSLIEHRRRHTGEKPFVCETCGIGFPSKSDLRHHPCGTSLSTEIGTFPCYLCGKVFTNKLELRRHTKAHEKKCDLCDQEFDDFKELKRHRRTHTQTKPFVCSVCTKGFSQKKTLKSHILKNHSSSGNMHEQYIKNDVIKSDSNQGGASNLSFQGLSDMNIYPGNGSVANSSIFMHAYFDRDVKSVYQQM